jgi:hypothetical protein
MKILKSFLIFILFIFNSCSNAQVSPKQNEAFVGGTRIKLTPPADFTLASQFSGYQLESRGSSIMITEIPGPFAETSAGFSNPSELKKRNMSVLNKQEVKLDGQTGLLLKVEQKAYETDFLKWLLVLGDEKETVIITATFPNMYEAELSEKLKASILTTTWDRKKSIIPTEGLSFTIEEKGKLKLSKRVSNMLMFTKDGIFPSKDVNDPLFIIGQSISKTAIPDNEEYAKARVLQISQVKDIKIEQSDKITVDNLNGYEIVANGKDTKSGQPMLIYQVILFEEQNYFLVQGLAGNENRQANLEVFKQMARTFKRTA